MTQGHKAHTLQLWHPCLADAPQRLRPPCTAKDQLSRSTCPRLGIPHSLPLGHAALQHVSVGTSVLADALERLWNACTGEDLGIWRCSVSSYWVVMTS